MKNFVRLIGAMRSIAIIALAAVIIFSMAACGEDDGGDDGATSVTYTSYDGDGNQYVLVVSKDPNRSAAFAPQAGDVYVLTIKSPNGTVIATSSGTVKTVSTSGLTLEKGGVEFTIVVSGSAITGINNAIPLDDGETRPPPASLSPNPPDEPGDDPATITYTVTPVGSPTTTALNFTFSADPGNLTAGEITLGGNASKGNATVTGTGTTRTLSPITVSTTGTATVSITKNGIETGIKNITVSKDSGGNGNDTWTNVTSWSQLNGTWKVSDNITYDVPEIDLTYFANYSNYTLTFNTNTTPRTAVISGTVTMTISGENLDDLWPSVKSGAEFALTMFDDNVSITIDDANYSYTITYNNATQQLGDVSDELLAQSGIYQINQNGTKLKTVNPSFEMILTKQ